MNTGSIPNSLTCTSLTLPIFSKSAIAEQNTFEIAMAALSFLPTRTDFGIIRTPLGIFTNTLSASATGFVVKTICVVVTVKTSSSYTLKSTKLISRSERNLATTRFLKFSLMRLLAVSVSLLLLLLLLLLL